jgi:16S rRNA (guanine1516-N2)-methyltransferase
MLSSSLKQKIAVAFLSADCKTKAAKLAEKLHLPLVRSDAEDFSLLLMVTPERLELHQIGLGKINPIYVDFLSHKMVQRYKHGGGRSQLIARAVGLRSGFKPIILDATAGLGSDAYVLASLGSEVTMLERSPVLVTLLEDGLKRLFANSTFAKSLKINLIESDAKDYLLKMDINNKFDVIYLDPMYPQEKKSALSKKELQILRALVGNDEDAALLLPLALSRAQKRVVVKRAYLAPAIPGPKPDIVFRGQSSRFDVYIV